MDGEAVKRIQDLTEAALARTITINGVEYATRPLHEIKPQPLELPRPLAFARLDSLLGYVKGPHDGKAVPRDATFLHVRGPTAVDLVQSLDDLNRRACIASAVYQPPKIAYGAWLPIEDFIISLQALFEQSGGRAALLALVGNLSDEEKITQADDGVTQRVAVKRGVVRVGVEEIPNPYLLAPFATFPEVNQPERPFVLRVRGNGGNISAALFPCDGDAWELDAVRRIQAYLEERLAGLVNVYA